MPFCLPFVAEHDLALLVPQRALDGDRAIAERLVGEDARQRRELDLAAFRRRRRLVARDDDRAARLLALRIEQRRQLRLDERPKSRVTSAICSSLISLRLEPRLLRILCQKLEASMSCTLPLRCAGLRLETIQT